MEKGKETWPGRPRQSLHNDNAGIEAPATNNAWRSSRPGGKESRIRPGQGQQQEKNTGFTSGGHQDKRRTQGERGQRAAGQLEDKKRTTRKHKVHGARPETVVTVIRENPQQYTV